MQPIKKFKLGIANLIIYKFVNTFVSAFWTIRSFTLIGTSSSHSILFFKKIYKNLLLKPNIQKYQNTLKWRQHILKINWIKIY
jgi:hypothetical protein